MKAKVSNKVDSQTLAPENFQPWAKEKSYLYQKL